VDLMMALGADAPSSDAHPLIRIASKRTTACVTLVPWR